MQAIVERLAYCGEMRMRHSTMRSGEEVKEDGWNMEWNLLIVQGKTERLEGTPHRCCAACPSTAYTRTCTRTCTCTHEHYVRAFGCSIGRCWPHRSLNSSVGTCLQMSQHALALFALFAIHPPSSSHHWATPADPPPSKCLVCTLVHPIVSSLGIQI